MKKFNKIFGIFFTVIFITVFSIFNFDEYKNFHYNKVKIIEKQNILNQNIKNFNVEKIQSLENIELYNTPNKKLLTNIVNIIENSKKEIFIEVYMLTEKRIQKALLKAHKKGISIKIILEKDPYMAYSINDKAYNNFKKAGVDIVWSDKKDYAFNHSKVLLIDGLSIISTGNLSYSTFTKNRDFFIFIKNKNIYSKLKENFKNDYKQDKINIYDDNLVFSPNTSRIKFGKLIDSAQKSIKMYFQYMKDEKFVEKLINIKQNKNIDITIIIAKTASNDKEMLKLKKAGIKIQSLSKYKMHSKAILIDKKYLFIGSINMSGYSIDRNREVGILIKNSNIINNFLKVFKGDIILSK